MITQIEFGEVEKPSSSQLFRCHRHWRGSCAEFVGHHTLDDRAADQSAKRVQIHEEHLALVAAGENFLRIGMAAGEIGSVSIPMS